MSQQTAAAEKKPFNLFEKCHINEVYALASILAGSHLDQSVEMAKHFKDWGLTNNIGLLLPTTKAALEIHLKEEPWASDPIIRATLESMTKPAPKVSGSLVEQLRDDDSMLVRALIGSMRSDTLRPRWKYVETSRDGWLYRPKRHPACHHQERACRPPQGGTLGE